MLDCARRLPPHESLAVADSALRCGDVRRDELLSAAGALTGPGAGRARLVVAHASPLAANAFESGLRGWCLEAGYRGLRPQVEVRSPGRLAVVDIADPRWRVGFEADGYEVHGTRRAFARDLVRHNWLQSAGWVTRRFAWEHVMSAGPWVVEQVRGAFREAALRRPA
ncbi:endonuclease domain-containing protein [Aquipuribacter sp. SD81]|uniref:endonuclease domain-containing protein n=1 Tax=Aquipuribacter sp. SD81 TaxID=3127703 RepID=UPI0030167752